MDDWIEVGAVTAAQDLLRQYRAAHADWTNDKTPIEALVGELGLQIATFHPNDYPPGTYGFLEPYEDLIWLCRDLAPTLRRFTLAHELGHAVLHRTAEQQAATPSNSPEDPCEQPDVQEDVTPFNEQNALEEVLGIGQSYNPRSERERAANIFAAELLMPLERVRTLYLNRQVPPHMWRAFLMCRMQRCSIDWWGWGGRATLCRPRRSRPRLRVPAQIPYHGRIATAGGSLVHGTGTLAVPGGCGRQRRQGNMMNFSRRPLRRLHLR